jgi:hypothetical protein
MSMARSSFLRKYLQESLKIYKMPPVLPSGGISLRLSVFYSVVAVLAQIKGRVEGIEVSGIQFILNQTHCFTETGGLK